MKSFYVILISLLLTACGGGSESKATSSSAEPTAATSTTSVATPPATETSTDTETKVGFAALAVSPEFDFTTDVTVTVKVAAKLVNERAFLNICPAETKLVSTATCYVRAPLTSAGLELSFVLPHQAQQVKADIWFYDVGMQPLRYEWQVDTSTAQQTWLIN